MSNSFKVTLGVTLLRCLIERGGEGEEGRQAERRENSRHQAIAFLGTICYRLL